MQALRNRALKERHWTKVFGVIGQVIPRDANFTLQVGLVLQVGSKQVMLPGWRWLEMWQLRQG